MEMRKYPEVKPESFKRVVVTDSKGHSSGYLQAHIVYDANRDKFVAPVGERFPTDLDDVVNWCYFDELHF